MRILVVSNFYPPHHIGGYELACREMADALAARGHEIHVLTSTHGVGRRQLTGNVWRWLTTDLGWHLQAFPRSGLNLLMREMIDRRAFKRIYEAVQPDIVYAWNLRHVCMSLCVKAQELGLPVCYFVFDNWLSKLGSDPWFSMKQYRPRGFCRRLGWALAGPLLGRTGLLPGATAVDLSHVQFASEYLKQVALGMGYPVATARVMHWGVDLNRYPYKATTSRGARLLYVGQIAPQKGVHTAIEGLRLLGQRGIAKASLTIVGGTSSPEYEAELRQLVVKWDLERKVSFLGRISREDLGSVFAEHDVLVFPSVWEEPFGITLLEGMASGIPIVGTGTGGAAEILKNETNALVFPRGNSEALANAVERLLGDESLYERIRRGGRLTVEQRFRVERTIDEIEQHLAEIVGHRPSPVPLDHAR